MKPKLFVDPNNNNFEMQLLDNFVLNCKGIVKRIAQVKKRKLHFSIILNFSHTFSSVGQNSKLNSSGSSDPILPRVQFEGYE